MFDFLTLYFFLQTMPRSLYDVSAMFGEEDSVDNLVNFDEPDLAEVDNRAHQQTDDTENDIAQEESMQNIGDTQHTDDDNDQNWDEDDTNSGGTIQDDNELQNASGVQGVEANLSGINELGSAPFHLFPDNNNPCKKFIVFPDIDSISLMTEDFRKVAQLFTNKGWAVIVDPNLSRLNNNKRTRVYIQTSNHGGDDQTIFTPSFKYRKARFIKLEDFPSMKVATIKGGQHGRNFSSLTFEVYLHVLSNEIVPSEPYLTNTQTACVVAAFELAIHFQSIIDEFIRTSSTFGITDDVTVVGNLTDSEKRRLHQILGNCMSARRRPEKDSMFASERIPSKHLRGKLGAKFLESLELAFVMISFRQGLIPNDVQSALECSMNLNSSSKTYLKLSDIERDCVYLTLNKILECKAINVKNDYDPSNEEWFRSQFGSAFDESRGPSIWRQCQTCSAT